jgi:MFS family permease
VTYRELLGLRGVGSLLAAASLARLADRMLALALVLYALARFHSPQLAGWATFAATAPGLVISPLAGALLDRIGAPRAIAADMGCSTGCVLIVGVLAMTGIDSAWSLLSLVAICSLSNPLSWAGIRTLLPGLVPATALGRANALDTAIHAAVDVCGPALAGVLSGVTGAAPALLVIALLYAAACLALLPMARRRPRSARGSGRGLLAEAMTGMAYVLHHRLLRSLSISYALYQAGWGILLVAVPVLAIRTLGKGASGDLLVGALWAISGAAGGVGALLAGRHGAPGQERPMMALGMLGTALAIYPVAALVGLPGLAIGLALVGFLAGPIDVGVLTLRQRSTAQTWLGRVMAVSISLNLSGLPVGAALAGVLLAWSLQATFAAAALACAAAALLIWILPER